MFFSISPYIFVMFYAVNTTLYFPLSLMFFYISMSPGIAPCFSISLCIALCFLYLNIFWYHSMFFISLYFSGIAPHFLYLYIFRYRSMFLHIFISVYIFPYLLMPLSVSLNIDLSTSHYNFLYFSLSTYISLHFSLSFHTSL